MLLTEIEGLEPLRAKLTLLSRVFYAGDARSVYVKAARRLRDAAQRLAPVGQHARYVNRRGVVWEPGKLRRSIIAFGSRRLDLGPAAFTRVNIFRGRERAPHAHLVAFGTRVRKPTGARPMVFFSRGSWVRTQRTLPTPPNPFFARALAAAGPGLLEDVLSDSLGLVLRTATMP